MSYLHDSEAMMHVGSLKQHFLDIHLQYSFLNYCSMSVSGAGMIDGSDECENDKVSVFAVTGFVW